MEKAFAIAFAVIFLLLSAGLLVPAGINCFGSRRPEKRDEIVCRGGFSDFFVGLALLVVGFGFSVADIVLLPGIPWLFLFPAGAFFLWGVVYIRHAINGATFGRTSIGKRFLSREYKYEDITRVVLLRGFTRWVWGTHVALPLRGRKKLRLYVKGKVVFRADEDYSGFEEVVGLLRRKVNQSKWENRLDKEAARLKAREEKRRKKQLEKIRLERERRRSGEGKK